jgi:2-hydroxymuconate-semialdehyde hydrolase
MMTLIVAYWTALKEKCVSEVTNALIRTGDYETYLNRLGEGQAKAILFLHGSGPGTTAWATWQYALAALAEEFDCLAPDLIGFGQSEHPEDLPQGAAAWFEVWMNQLSELLDNLGLSKVHLVGNSVGGALSLHFLHRHPERVERVVLTGTVGTPHMITNQLDEAWGFYDDPSPELMAEVIRWCVYDPAIVGGDLDARAEMSFEAATKDEKGRRSFAAMFPAPRQQHIDDLVLPELVLQGMNHPVLLVHGRDDVIIPLETSLYLLARLTEVQMHVFGQCRHWVMIEYSDAFNELVSDFLTSKET